MWVEGWDYTIREQDVKLKTFDFKVVLFSFIFKRKLKMPRLPKAEVEEFNRALEEYAEMQEQKKEQERKILVEELSNAIVKKLKMKNPIRNYVG